jgi:hypothetical protein
MKRQKNYILRKNIFQNTLKLYLPVVLFLNCFIGEHVKSDSTFFPDDMAETNTDNITKESSDDLNEWAELKPSKKAPQKNEVGAVSLSQSNAPIQEKPASQAQESKTIATKPPDSEVPLPSPTTPKTASADEKKHPLKLTKVDARPKALPVHEADQTSSSLKEHCAAKKTVLSYSEAANDRSPLGILSPSQEIHSQKWYIYSSAIRGLKNPSDNVHIVSMEGAASNRGEEIKKLLVEMGIESKKVEVIFAKGDENQAGIIYIFAGN